nr:uncharacterized protein LOC126534349 isoform X2 [Dermacentor andersoni]
MSQKTRGRYRRYLELNSTDQVPKQTLSSIAKRAKTRSASKVIAPNKQAATIVCAKDSPDHRAASVSENASRYGNLSMLPAMAASCLDNEPPMPYASNTCERDERGALIMFVSDTFGGRASGKACVNVYGILDQLQPFEDDLMVDKGFNIDDRCTELGVGVIQPPFLRTQTQFS